MAATAYLYSDGALIFKSNENYASGYTAADVIGGPYTGWDTDEYNSATLQPWYNELESIVCVSFEDSVSVRSLAMWFTNAKYMTSFNSANLDTSSVTKMSTMFYQCSALTNLDLSGFDTSSVTNMNSMFFGCTRLAAIYVSGLWSTSAVSSSGNMFTGCGALVGENGTTLTASIVDATYARIDTADTPGYLSSINALYNSEVLVKYGSLRNIALAMRSKLGVSTKYKPREMSIALDEHTAEIDSIVMNQDDLIAQIKAALTSKGYMS